MKVIFKKLFAYLLTIILVVNSSMSLAYAKENKPRISAHNAIALDRESRQVLFEQNAYELVPMASTTKILTALITIERGDLDSKFTVSKKAASIRGSKVGYKAGEEITIRELLYGLMYKSGNDAAITLAEGIGGSIEGFAEIMNHFAVSIGILDSHFESPHGLDSREHYSSAYDLALLTAKGMEYDVFREVVGTKEITKDKYNFTRDYNNINKILWKIPGANGVKTGYTGQAGKCLVSSVNHDGKDIIIVVLDCPDRWNQTEKIYKYVEETMAYESMVMKELVKKEDNDEYTFCVEQEQFEVKM
ncbi:MAG: D-alanyl-D-alanine carboxypeptidase [Clostridium sp.]|nr:D-alanyl-D-alanine carboxypeptidase [Clostridium sp.]